MILSFLLKYFPSQIAYAHCDIPCKIYDPFRVQQAAHTIIRMTQLLGEVERSNEIKAEHDISRITRVKEKHSDILEEELETLRNDYFKEEHYKAYPRLDDLFIETIKSASTARKEINMEAAEATLESVMEIAEIFFKSKDLTPLRVKSFYPTEREIVIFK